MIEVGVVFDQDHQPLCWHEPPGRTAVSLPDSRTLWETLWGQRDRVRGFAHSHPGRGRPAPSQEDMTTFAAVERALGRRLEWWIASEDGLALCHVTDDLACVSEVVAAASSPPWLDELRKRSYTNGG